MCEGYCSCLACVCVCVCVCSSSSCFSVRLYPQPTILTGFSWILTRGFSKEPSIRKLWREKSFSRTFRINEGQKLPEAKLVSQVLLERLATGSHGHKTSEIGHCLPLLTVATRHRTRMRSIERNGCFQAHTGQCGLNPHVFVLCPLCCCLFCYFLLFFHHLPAYFIFKSASRA